MLIFFYWKRFHVRLLELESHIVFDYFIVVLYTHLPSNKTRDRRGRDRMVFGFTTIYASRAYHH
jgi:hypothetical protein